MYESNQKFDRVNDNLMNGNLLTLEFREFFNKSKKEVDTQK